MKIKNVRYEKMGKPIEIRDREMTPEEEKESRKLKMGLKYLLRFRD